MVWTVCGQQAPSTEQQQQDNACFERRNPTQQANCLRNYYNRVHMAHMASPSAAETSQASNANEEQGTTKTSTAPSAAKVGAATINSNGNGNKDVSASHERIWGSLADAGGLTIFMSWFLVTVRSRRVSWPGLARTGDSPTSRLFAYIYIHIYIYMHIYICKSTV